MIAALKRAVRRTGTALLRATFSRGPGIAPAHWGLGYDASGELAADGVPLRALLERWGSPLHVVLGDRLVEHAASVRRGGSELFYSCKTNPVAGVLSLLRETGAGIEVISAYELWLALRCGFRPDEIVYNGPAKSEASLREAVELGILAINVNHRAEIPLLARIARETGCRPRVGVRVVVPGGWAGQFGVPIAGGGALAAYREALGTGLLDVVAIHAHRGHLVRSAAELTGFADAVLDFAAELYRSLGLALELFDFGGSLAVPSVAGLRARDKRLNRTFGVPLPPPDPGATLSLFEYARTLAERTHARAAREGWPEPRVIVEAGRAVTSDAQLLLASVTTLTRPADRTFAILDAGINVAEPVPHEYHQLFPLRRGAPDEQYALAGPICSPADILYPSVRLPRLHPGDAVAIMDSGAYFVPFSTPFSFPRPAIVLLRGGRDTLLRRAETFDDLAALDVEPAPAMETVP